MTRLPPGEYPRPMLVRDDAVLLDRICDFRFDPADEGTAERWHDENTAFPRTIQLPFAPESAASGIGETGHHPIVWYRLTVTAEDLLRAGLGSEKPRLILHVGAADRHARVWVNGLHVGDHSGGYTPFELDVTDALRAGAQTIVFRTEDDPFDAAAPRGKQDWLELPHSIWYHRTTGIWRTVWIEALPTTAVQRLRWTPQPQSARVSLALSLSRRPSHGSVTVTLSHHGEELARATVGIAGDDHPEITLTLPRQRNGHEHDELLWTPERPVLLDARIELVADGSRDEIDSYLGYRSVAVDRGHFLLNDRPYFIRAVLEQGYWPDSHFTAPSPDAMRAEVELIKQLGFNTARLHQKVEDPRFLYWCDRQGLLVWVEQPSANEFSTSAVLHTTLEWASTVVNSASHPSVAVWVPLNESWGVQQISHDPAQRAHARALASLTRSLDPTRPVLSNDGWEHVDSDLLTIHDYCEDPAEITDRYADAVAVRELATSIGPFGRRIALPGQDLDRPVILSEFGGIRYALDGDGWGYATAGSEPEFRGRLARFFAAANAAGALSGYCYTQLTDTEQERNGLCFADRTPKTDIGWLGPVIRGTVSELAE